MNAPQQAGILSLFKHKAYCITLIANTISRIGDSIDTVAYSWLVYQLTGSLLLMGSIFAVSALPNLLFGFVAGVFVDRLPKKPLIIAGHALRGIFVGLLALLFALGRLEPWMLFIFAFVQSTVEAFVHPASASFFQRIVPKQLYLQANSLSESASSLAQLLGLGLAGAIIAVLGIAGAIALDALSFFIAALGIAFVALPATGAAVEPVSLAEQNGQAAKPAAARRFWTDLKDGLRFVWHDKLIRITVILAALANFALAPFGALQAAYVKDVLGWGAAGLSVLGIAFTVGIGLGSLLLARFGRNSSRLRLILNGFLLVGLFFAAMALPALVDPPFWRMILAAGFGFLCGLSLPLINATIGAYLMENTPEHFMGRTSSVLSVLCTCMMPIGAAFSGLVAELTSLPFIFAAMGLLIILFTLVIRSLPIIRRELAKKTMTTALDPDAPAQAEPVSAAV